MSPARLVLVLAVLLGLSGLLAWLGGRPDPEPFPERPPVASEDPLLPGDPARVRRLLVHRDLTGRVRDFRLLEVLFEEGRWELREPLQDRANPAVLAAALRRLYSRDWRPAPEDAGRPAADLGLDPPLRVAEIEDLDGGRHRLEVGAAEAAGAWYHARRDGQPIHVAASVVRELDRPTTDWRDPRLIPDSPRVRRLLWQPVAGEGRVLELRAGGWELLEPVAAPLDPLHQQGLRRLLGTLVQNLPEERLDEADREDFRREGDRLECHYADGSRLVLWSRGPRAFQEGRPYALPCPRSVFDLLRLPVEELRSKDLVRREAAEVFSLRLRLGGRQADFRRQAGGWLAPGGVLLPAEGEPADPRYQDAQVLGELLQRLGSLRLERPEPRPEGEPAGEIWLSISRRPVERGSEILVWWKDGSVEWIAPQNGPSALRLPFRLTEQVERLLGRYGTDAAGD